MRSAPTSSTAARRSVEGFVTHNGDLDFFTLHGTTYSLGDVQRLLGWLLSWPLTEPSSAMLSACVFFLTFREVRKKTLEKIRSENKIRSNSELEKT